MANSANTASEGAIISLGPEAINEVKRLMSQEKEETLFLRLGVSSGGCSGMSYSMTFETEKAQFDREFEFDGVKVLVDLKAMSVLAGTTLEFRSGLMGSGFEFNNPKAKRSCGCGSSFSC